MSSLDEHDPQRVLVAARDAARRGDDAGAVERYEWLFDHALEHDGTSMYGVRLSYCLQEWAEIGRRYPAACERLEARRLAAWASYESTEAALHFHEFVALSRVLGRLTEALDRFRELRSTRPSAALELGSLIWDDLANAGDWSTCSELLTDGPARYLASLEALDDVRHALEAHPTTELPDIVLEGFGRDLTRLLDVLDAVERRDEARAIRGRLERDLRERGCERLLASLPVQPPPSSR